MKRLLFIFLLPGTYLCNGSHIVGGEFELSYLCPNTYDLKLILYFDELNGFEELQDQDVYAHIFRKRDNMLMQVVYLPKLGQREVPYYQEWCDDNEVQTLRIAYGDTVLLSDSLYWDPEGYYVAWENCCRNYSVTNVIVGNLPSTSDPFTNNYSGQTYYLEFPPVVKNGEPFINSSPSNFPALNSYACPNVAYWANFAARDPDGDSLVYTITSPLDNLPDREPRVTRPGPYPEVNWVSGFGPARITGGDPEMQITPDGFLTVTPKFSGLFVFAVKVVEWRDGEQIGIIQREFQLFVDDLCAKTYPPVINSKLGSETTYLDVGELNISFDNTISPEDRCINLLVTDKDAEDSDEKIFIKAIPLNFEDEDSLVNELLPSDREIVLSDGNTTSFDICFPECPLVDPLIKDVLQIAILVFDDSCPLPLLDTLKIEVRIEPPDNQNPSILVDGSQVDYFERMVTETAGGALSIPIEAFDPDNQELAMEIIPVNDFDPARAGISFSEPVAVPGRISTSLLWNFDCMDDTLDYSEGYDTSVSDDASRRSYDLFILVEDMDDCEFSRADTLEMHLTVEFPGEAHPYVFIEGENVNQDYFAFEYDISEMIQLGIKALDGPSDNDLLNLFAIGDNYNLEEFGASFPPVSGGAGIEPGTFSTFNWPLICSKFSLVEQDTFRTHFVVTDIDACNLANSDTLTVDFIILPGENSDPDLRIRNISGEQEIKNDTLITDISKNVRFDLVGEDPDADSLYLRLLYINGALVPNDFEFKNVRGKGSVASTFSLDLGCEMLGESYSEANYQFAFLLEDLNCSHTGADTLLFNLIVMDTPVDDSKFLPANVFTPNGDGINDFFGMSSYDELRNDRFILPLDNCLGQFEHVSIINRYGKEVFFSEDRNFKWYAESIPAGVYYYVITYSNKVYKGNVTVLF